MGYTIYGMKIDVIYDIMDKILADKEAVANGEDGAEEQLKEDYATLLKLREKLPITEFSNISNEKLELYRQLVQEAIESANS
jgi:hypothetical protein